MADTRLVVVARGASGPPGPPGAPLAPVTWDDLTVFRQRDYVIYGTDVYIALVDNTGVEPGSNPGVWRALDLETHEGAQVRVDTALAAAKEYADDAVADDEPRWATADALVLQEATDYSNSAISAAGVVLSEGFAEGDIATLLEAEDYIAARLDLVAGVPTLTTTDVFPLDTDDPYYGPTIVPPDVPTIVQDDSGGLLLVQPVVTILETPSGAQAKADVARQAAVSTAEAYTDLEMGLHTAASDPHPQYALDTDLAGYQPISQKDQPNGFAGLDGAGKIQASELPGLAIGDTWVVHSQAAMLALVAQRGDVAVRDDIDPKGPVSFRLAADDPTVLANWVQLNYPGDVVTVNGRSGAVTGLAEQASLDTTNTNVTANTSAIADNSTAIAALPTVDDVYSIALIMGG